MARSFEGPVTTPATDIQGWYCADNQSERLRVRLSVEGRSLVLHNLAGAPVARWSLDQLENRGIPYWGRDWPIGDRDLPQPTMMLENDGDYATVQKAAPGLRSLHSRAWRHLLLWPDAHRNLKAGPALIWMLLLIAVALATWQSIFH